MMKSPINDILDSYARAFEQRFQEFYEGQGQEQLQELIRLSSMQEIQPSKMPGSISAGESAGAKNIRALRSNTGLITPYYS